MEEINIKELFRLFTKKIGLVILIVLFSILIGAIYSFFIDTPKYESNTRLVLTGKTDISDGVSQITTTDLTLNSKLVSTYREVIKSRTVLKQVIETLGLNYSVGELENMIDVSSVEDTEMISISVKSEVAKETSEIANELASVFSERIVDIYNIENISIIDKAEVPTSPVNVNIVKSLIIYFMIGLVLACVVIFVIYYFDTTLKEESQLEQIGLVVLATVPQKLEEKGGKR